MPRESQAKTGTGPTAVMGIVAPLTRGVRYPGKSRFVMAQRVNGHRRPVPGSSSSDTPRESHAKFRDGTV